MNQKLVSVIIPTYNRAGSVVKAIQSVKDQNYPAIQIIVVDDGSVDDTRQKVAEFENVEYYYQTNKRQAAARNLGLKYAKGEYIASLDSDDIWDANFLETAVNALEKYEADFVFLNWQEVFENRSYASGWENSKKWRKYVNGSKEEWIPLNAKEVRELFLNICPAPSSALLIRRSSFVSNWNEEMKIADDWYLILEMVLSKPCRAAFTLSTYWAKHIHSSNIYHGRELLEVVRDLGLHDEALFASRFDKQLTDREKAFLKRRMATHFFNFGRLSIRHQGFSAESLKYINRSFVSSPVFMIYYILLTSAYFLKNRYRIVRKKLE